MSVIYAEGVANISVHEGVVKLDLVMLDQAEKDGGKATESGRVVMSIPGLVRLHEMVGKAIDGMVEKGVLIKSNA